MALNPNQVEYHAKVLSSCIARSREKKTPSVKFAFKTEYQLNAPTVPVVHTVYWDGWLTDGALEMTLETLGNVFGWYGDTLQELNDTTLFQGEEVNLVCSPEEYEGKSRLVVDFVNNPNAGGIGNRIEDDDLAGLSQSMDLKLRAIRDDQRQKGKLPKKEAMSGGSSGPADGGAKDDLPF